MSAIDFMWQGLSIFGNQTGVLYYTTKERKVKRILCCQAISKGGHGRIRALKSGGQAEHHPARETAPAKYIYIVTHSCIQMCAIMTHS